MPVRAQRVETLAVISVISRPAVCFSSIVHENRFVIYMWVFPPSRHRLTVMMIMMMQAKLIRHSILVTLLLTCSGCSSLGLSLWPAQFPLLRKAKDYARQSPIPSGLNHELAKQAITQYYIEPGDRLLIEPIDLDSEFRAVGDQEVLVDGSIDLGRFGRIRVSGMTIEGIEAAISDQILAISGETEAVNVQLIDSHAARVYVLGAVGSPGAYEIDGNETVLDAILLAGGLTSTASPCDIIMVRPTDPCDCRVVQRVCYRQITQLGDVTTNYQLQPGDRVVVGERTLREELSIWKQATPCPCCDRSNCVQCDPTAENYQSRFAAWALPFIRPARPQADETSDSDVSSQPATRGDSGRPLNDAMDSDADDSDFFLPPRLPEETGEKVPAPNGPAKIDRVQPSSTSSARRTRAVSR